MVANKFISYLIHIYRYFIHVHVQLRLESRTAMDAYPTDDIAPTGRHCGANELR